VVTDSSLGLYQWHECDLFAYKLSLLIKARCILTQAYLNLVRLTVVASREWSEILDGEIL
jgi:hypothetical protein